MSDFLSSSSPACDVTFSYFGRFDNIDKFIDYIIEEEVREILYAMEIYTGDSDFDKEYERLQQEITLDGTRNWAYEHKQYCSKELKKMKKSHYREVKL